MIHFLFFYTDEKSSGMFKIKTFVNHKSERTQLIATSLEILENPLDTKQNISYQNSSLKIPCVLNFSRSKIMNLSVGQVLFTETSRFLS